MWLRNVSLSGTSAHLAVLGTQATVLTSNSALAADQCGDFTLTQSQAIRDCFGNWLNLGAEREISSIFKGLFKRHGAPGGLFTLELSLRQPGASLIEIPFNLYVFRRPNRFGSLSTDRNGCSE